MTEDRSGSVLRLLRQAFHRLAGRYGAHEGWFCSERCGADADMALALEMLRDRQ